MASLVQQSTTQLALKFFLVLSSDHISPATGLSPTVTIRKEGGSFAAPSGAVTEIANGWYQVAGNATDTNTLGDILLHASVATADNCDMVAAEVVAFNPQTANLGLSNVPVNVAQWNGTNVASPATAGIPDVNTKNINNVAAALDANNLLKVDVEDINGSATAAQALNNSTNTICWGTCSGGTVTTAVVSTLNNPSSLTASGQLIGRTIIFLGSTGTGGVQAQASNITASTTGATPTITFSTMTTAPANGDKFAIL